MFSSRWLHATGDLQRELYSRASFARREVFGDKVYVRAVVEVSNFCRENCGYCGMRRDNRNLSRFRLTLEQLREIVFESLPASVTDINIQTGEDPKAVREIVLPLVKEITSQTSLGVSVCLGTLDEALYAELMEAGARYYIIKLETANPRHYESIQSPGTLEERLAAIQSLAQNHWYVSSGFILGLPEQKEEDILDTLQVLNRLPLAGCSVSPFIPGEGTPFKAAQTGNIQQTLNAVAMMRLAKPHWIIPAVSAMKLLESTAYATALKVGSNLATINLTPEKQRTNYQIYKRDRFIMKEERVLREIEAAGLQPSQESIYHFLESSKTDLLAQGV